MAAILCLVFLPLTAAVGFMVSVSTPLCGVIFVALAAFVLFGAFSLMRGWEGNPEH